MPRPIDWARRRDDVARAAVELVARCGPSGVTVRSLAALLGGSNSRITHYFNGRAEILERTHEYILLQKLRDLPTITERATYAERVRTCASWALTVCANSETFERARVALASEPVRGGRSTYAADLWHATTRDALVQLLAPVSGSRDVTPLAELLLAVHNGLAFSVIENPNYWDNRRRRDLSDAVFSFLEHAAVAARDRR